MLRPAALRDGQATAARWTAGVAVLGNLFMLGLAIANRTAFGLPHPLIVGGALVATVAISLAIYKGVSKARYALAWYWGIAIPALLGEPFVSQRPALIIFIPVALAVCIAGPRTVLAMAVVPLMLVVARTGLESPYLSPSYLGAFAILTAILYVTQRALLSSIAEATKMGAIFEALARETNEVISIAGPGRDGNAAGARYVSPSVTRVLGYSAEEPAKLGWNQVIHPEDMHKIAKMSGEIRAREGISATGQFRMRHKDGSYRWMVARGTNLLHHPHVGGVLSTFVDVTSLVEEREAVERKLERDASHDAVTGLPNRRALVQSLTKAIENTRASNPADAKEDRSPFSVLFVDIDGFKVVNDSLGHDYGEKLITAIASRFAPMLGPTATIFRFGGDELVLLVEAELDTATDIGEGLVAAMRRPFMIDGREVFVTASMGIAAVRSTHDRPEAVIKDAEVAMYRAKERGKNRCERFDEALRDRAERRLDLEQALRRALDNGELNVVFQPKVLASDGRIVGFEALARWQSARLGSIGPSEFIPLAEETGLIEPIGRWVLEQAVAQLAQWRGRMEKSGQLKMAVNLSNRQLLGQSDIASELQRILEKYEVPASEIELEITESVLMTNVPKAAERLAHLKKLGVKLAIDDFGTGYSSLSYLKRFPVDVLKVDRAFVIGLGVSREDAAIVHLVVTLAQALGLETVAEGVETDEQLAELAALGCDQIQGYIVSRPLNATDAQAFLEKNLRHFAASQHREAAE
ncbi:MAG: EAL domain-containing protein [Polyangiaceae bacterium]